MKQKNILKTTSLMVTTQKGFTMMEFLVAAILGLIVILAVGKTYNATSNLNQRGEERLAIQQDIRAATTMITRDAHIAGSFGCLNLANAAYTASNGLKVNVHDYSSLTDLKYAVDTRYGVQALTAAPVGAPEGFAIDGRALLFQYGVGAATLKSLTVPAGTKKIGSATFKADQANQKELVKTATGGSGFLVLASCSRMDIVKGSMSGSDVSAGAGLPIGAQTDMASKDFHTVNNLEVMRYVMHAYAVGTYKGQKGLYRFTLGTNGKWNTTPQLLSPNVTAMTFKFAYSDPADCNDDAAKNTENFTFANDIDPKMPPSLLWIKLSVAGESGGQVDGTTRESIYETTANIRGGNICASRTLKE